MRIFEFSFSSGNKVQSASVLEDISKELTHYQITFLNEELSKKFGTLPVDRSPNGWKFPLPKEEDKQFIQSVIQGLYEHLNNLGI